MSRTGISGEHVCWYVTFLVEKESKHFVFEIKLPLVIVALLTDQIGQKD